MKEKIYLPKGNLSGILNTPYSKSISHRALIMAGFAEEGTIIRNLSQGKDVLATKRAMEQMGVIYEKIGENYVIKRNISQKATMINCQSSGTTLRFMTAISAYFNLNCILTGDASLKIRPMKELIIALEKMGAKIDSNEYYAPIKIIKLIDKKDMNIEIKGHNSSQFISSLILLASLIKDNISKIKIIKPIVSRPYLNLTISMLEKIGVNVKEENNTITVIGQKNYTKSEFDIPIDMSSAAFFLVGGALPGNSIEIENYDKRLPQADSNILNIMKKAGAKVSLKNDKISVKYKKLIGFEADLSNCPDLFPILCVLAVFCEGKTKLFNAPHLKFKESNRISSMVNNLRLIDVKIEEYNDGVIIFGGFKDGKNIAFNSYNDHRIAMALAILATQLEGEFFLNDGDCIKDSFPTFFYELDKILH